MSKPQLRVIQGRGFNPLQDRCEGLPGPWREVVEWCFLSYFLSPDQLRPADVAFLDSLVSLRDEETLTELQIGRVARIWRKVSYSHRAPDGAA